MAPVISVGLSAAVSRGADLSGARRPVISTNLIQVRHVTLTQPHAAVASPSSTITAFPLNSPPINGFTPWVALGMTDENDQDDFSFSGHASSSPGTAPSGPWHTLPTGQPQRFAPAIFDTGSSAHLVSLTDWQDTFDFFGSHIDGTIEQDLAGAGTATEPVLVNDAAGFYMTGFQNASTVGSGTSATLSVAPGTLIGHYNVSVLSTEYPPPDPNNPSAPSSILPNIVGAPMVSQYQAAIRTSRQRSLVIKGDTYDTPSVELRPLATNSKVPGGYSRMDLSAEAPQGSVTTPASYFPDPQQIVNGKPVTDNPEIPTQWAALMTKTSQSWVNGSDSGQSFNNAKFLFDTGAQVTVLSSSTASAAGFTLTGENPDTPEFYVEVGGVGGVTEQVPGFYMDSLSLHTNGGDITYSNVPVLVLDLIDPSTGSGFVPGIIGMNLFTDRDIIVNGGAGTPGPYLAIGPVFREWSSAGGGNWSDASKWSAAGVPNNQSTPAVFRGAITAPATVAVDSNFTVGSLTFDSANAYTLAGTGRITMQTFAETSAISASPASIWVGAGSHTISAPMTFAVNTVIETDKAASTITISNDVTVSGTTTTLTKLGPGTLQMKNVRAPNLTVSGGTVRMLSNGGQSGTSNVGALTVAGGAKLDLVNNDLVVRNGSAATLTNLIQSGRNGGSWTGSGIVTSAASGNLTTLGVASASQVKGIASGATSTWSGQTVTGTDALVMYTYGGDANLDGKINVDDYGRIDSSAPLGISGWYNGDFNYDGKINVDDYGIIDFNIGIQGPPLLSAGGDGGGNSFSAVPEPAGLGILLAASTSFLCGRRRSIRDQ